LGTVKGKSSDSNHWFLFLRLVGFQLLVFFDQLGEPKARLAALTTVGMNQVRHVLLIRVLTVIIRLMADRHNGSS
jgi:hypothetical protein